MESNKVVIVDEIKYVMEEIERLKLMIKNLNSRIISNSDKIGMLAFLNNKKSKLTQSCDKIAGFAIATKDDT